MRSNTNIWPVHPQPAEDELLSSWMIQIAHGNGLKIETFYSRWLGRDSSLWSRDIDRSASPELLSKLAEKSGVSNARLSQMTLSSLAGRLSEEIPAGGHLNWVTPLGIYHRQRISHGLSFCPECLASDQRPYFRLSWRLAFITACDKHARTLLDACPKCGSMVQPHRSDFIHRTVLLDFVTVARCTACDYDLRGSEPGPEASAARIAFQNRLLKAMRDGHTDLLGAPGLPSLLLFSGLRSIAFALSASWVVKDPTHRRQVAVEKWRVACRAALLEQLSDLMTEWPQRFLSHFESLDQPLTLLNRSQTVLPFWLYTVCDPQLRRDKPVLSADEVRYIVRMTEAETGRFTLANSRRLFGRDLGKAMKSGKPAIEDIDVETLMADIDHRVAETIGRERLDYLRDKVMLVTARVLKKNQRELSSLKVSDVPDPLWETTETHLLTVPKNPEELNSYFRWYLREVRPLYPTAQVDPWLFICSGPHGRMSESLIGSRLGTAVKQAHLHRRIRNFKQWTSASRRPFATRTADASETLKSRFASSNHNAPAGSNDTSNRTFHKDAEVCLSSSISKATDVISQSSVKAIHFADMPSGRWLVVWHGDVDRRTSATTWSQPTLCTVLESLDTPRRHPKEFYFPIAQLFALTLGSVWLDGSLVGCLEDWSVERKVLIDPDKSNLCQSGVANSSDGQDRFLLPFEQFRHHRNHTKSWCVRVASGTELFLIPCSELIRFYFGSSGALIKELCKIDFNLAAVCTDHSLTEGRASITLSEKVPSASGVDVARLAFDPTALRAARSIARSVISDLQYEKPGNKVYFKVPLPFSGFSSLKVRGIPIDTEDGLKRFLVAEILQCSSKLPWESLRIVYSYQSSTDNHKRLQSNVDSDQVKKKGTPGAITKPDSPTIDASEPSSKSAVTLKRFERRYRFRDLFRKPVRYSPLKEVTAPEEGGDTRMAAAAPFDSTGDSGASSSPGRRIEPVLRETAGLETPDIPRRQWSSFFDLVNTLRQNRWVQSVSYVQMPDQEQPHFAKISLLAKGSVSTGTPAKPKRPPPAQYVSFVNVALLRQHIVLVSVAPQHLRRLGPVKVWTLPPLNGQEALSLLDDKSPLFGAGPTFEVVIPTRGTNAIVDVRAAIAILFRRIRSEAASRIIPRLPG